MMRRAHAEPGWRGASQTFVEPATVLTVENESAPAVVSRLFCEP
jgi:hypothetical protein